MKTRALAAALLVALAPVAVGAPAYAQPADDPIVKAARARFQEGVDFFDKGQFENARASFLQAYALRKHPAVLMNLAQSCTRSGHTLEAAKYFQQYLRDATSISAAQRTDAENGLAEARAKLGRIEITAPAGTDITMDNERIGTAPFAEPVDVEPGSHTLKSSTDTVRVTATAGQKVQAKFGSASSATPAPVPVPAPTTPSGSAATTPPPPSHADPAPAEGPVTADTGSKKSLLAPPDNMVPVYVGLGVGVIGLGGTIAFAIAKSSAQSSADSVANAIKANGGTAGVCSSTKPATVTKFGNACSVLADDNNKVDTNATIANVSIVVMVLGLATATGWYLFGPKKDDAAPKTGTWERPLITPILGPQIGGLSASGTF